jgi:hypothetical protein
VAVLVALMVFEKALGFVVSIPAELILAQSYAWVVSQASVVESSPESEQKQQQQEWVLDLGQ